MKRSFFVRLFSGYVVITVLLSAMILFFSFEQIRDYHIRSLTGNLRSMAAALKPSVVPLIRQGRTRDLDRMVKQLDREAHTRITIVDRDGKVLADSEEDPAAMENHAARPEVREALASARAGTALRHSATVGQMMLYVAVPMDAGGQRLGAIRVSLFLKDIDGFIASLKRTLINITVLILLISLLIALIVSRSLTRPVRVLMDAAHRVASGDFATRVAMERKDEFNDLAGTFNYMTGQIQTLFTELSHQKDELNTVIVSLPEGLVVLDAKEKIILANDSFRKIADHAPVEGKFYWEVFRGKDFSDLVTRVRTGKASVSGEVAAGDRVYLTAAQYLAYREEIIIVMHDITEIRRLEKIKKDFAVNVSHELRTPLTAIKGYVETMEETIDEKNRRYLDIVKRHTDRLVNIIEDLLLLSEMEEKGEEIKRGPVDLTEVLENIRVMFQPRVTEKKLSLDISVDPDLPDIQADQFKLEQLLINLIDNAVKYTEQGGVAVTASRKGDEAEIKVKDTGIGIPKEHQDRVFERFYVVDKSRSRKLGGTGLGLSIVKHIVLLHNGRISVESAPGAGTAFIVNLPIK